MRRNNKQQKAKPKHKGEESLTMVPKGTIPKQVSDQLSTGFTLRYITTGIGGAAQTNVTWQNLLDSWMIATSPTTAYQLFDFVKVKRVIIRALTTAAPNGNLAASVGVEFPGLSVGRQGGGKQASDSNIGTNRPAVVVLRPDRGSQAAQWQSSSTDIAFTLRATDYNAAVIIGALIDVEVAFKNSGDVSPAAISSAAAGMSTGNLYFGGVDGGRLAATWARSVFIPRV